MECIFQGELSLGENQGGRVAHLKAWTLVLAHLHPIFKCSLFWNLHTTQAQIFLHRDKTYSQKFVLSFIQNRLLGLFFNTTTYKQYILHLLQLCCCSSNQVCIDIILLLYHLYSEFCSVLYTALVLHFMCYFHIK